MKRITVTLLALLLCLGLTACTGNGGGKERETLPVTGKLTVAVLQVGKADAIVIHTENRAMLIDTGESDDGGKVLNYLNRQGISRVDYMLITHYDRDHVGGADRILQYTEVGEIIRPDYVGEREEYDTFIADIQELGITDRVMSAGAADITFMLDDVQVTVNAFAKTTYTNASGVVQDNNFSLVTRLHHGNQVLLFTGDCEDDRLAELIAGDADWSADWLKVPYHGNATKLTAAFVNKVNPSYAVICDSAKNPADGDTLKALASAKVYETKDGTVITVSDGASLSVTQQEAE